MNVFFDMDGVLTIYERDAYRAPDYKWRQLDGHYFRSVKPDQKAIEVFRILSNTANVNTFVLTAVLNEGPIMLEQITDKIQWLNDHMPEVDPSKQFIPSVSAKNRTIQAVLFQNKDHLSPSDILIDDYNPNLLDWADAGGTAVKYINQLNHAASYKGIILPNDMPADDIAQLFDTISRTALFREY